MNAVVRATDVLPQDGAQSGFLLDLAKRGRRLVFAFDQLSFGRRGSVWAKSRSWKLPAAGRSPSNFQQE